MIKDSGEEAMVKAKYFTLQLYFGLLAGVMIAIAIFLLFTNISFGGSSMAGVGIILAIILLLLVALFYIFLSKRKSRELQLIKTMSREARDEREVQADSKFIIGALMAVFVILFFFLLSSPAESIIPMAIAMGFILLLALGFYKYNLKQE